MGNVVNNSNETENFKNILWLVVPCYNEQEILHNSSIILKDKLYNLIHNKKISEKSKILFIDDGSKDDTWNIIKNLNKEDSIFTGIKLSCNCGHQNALLAGLLTARKKADITISIDADLQDDVDAIDDMIEKFFKGAQIVYGVRCDRESDSFFKKFSAELFYKTANFLGAKTVYNHADFRLMSSKVVGELKHFKEVNLFLRGLVPLIGYKYDQTLYKRKKRTAGYSKYPLKKMISFAIDGITSCSTKLINIIFFVGLLLIFSSVTFITINFIYKLFSKEFMVIFFSIWFLGGLNLVALSIVGVYVGKTYLETKHRPRFIIEKSLIDD